jgi:dTDP-4-amino-4,6-dideoxygalactose transaminase
MSINIASPDIGDKEINAVMEIMKSGNIACGKEVELFEKEFADYIGTKYCVATTSGTASLCLALKSLDVEYKNVITTPFSFFASTSCILYNNGFPFFVDIKDDLNIDEEKIELYMKKNNLKNIDTIAILPVHLFGKACNMDKIIELSKKYNLRIVEDCCQAHGTTFKGKKVGNADIGCFSFYPTKNICAGEMGAVTTNDKNVYNKILAYRNHGQNGRYNHEIVGYNYRPTNIHAAIARIQLEKIDSYLEKRKANAKAYNELLKDIDGIIIPIVDDGHSFNQYTILVREEQFGKNRDQLFDILKYNNINCGIYYKQSILRCKALNSLEYESNLAIDLNAQVASKSVISLPVHPKIKINDIEIICEVIKNARS